MQSLILNLVRKYDCSCIFEDLGNRETLRAELDRLISQLALKIIEQRSEEVVDDGGHKVMIGKVIEHIETTYDQTCSMCIDPTSMPLVFFKMLDWAEKLKFSLSILKELNSTHTLNRSLIRAIYRQDIDAVRFILATGAADVDAFHGMALKTAAKTDSVELVNICLSAGADLDADEGSVLIGATCVSALNVVKHLVSKGASVNVKGGRPLVEAIKNNNQEMFEFLLESKADFTLNDHLPLSIALSHGRDDMARRLLAMGSVPRKNDRIQVLKLISGGRSHIKMILDRQITGKL